MTQYSRDGTSENLNVFICFATVSFVLHFKQPVDLFLDMHVKPTLLLKK